MVTNDLLIYTLLSILILGQNKIYVYCCMCNKYSKILKSLDNQSL